ncbi:hypothetical protein N7520_002831 [Penicillium odoratum]|uniref:uncharacterized protein n=1 Tax=Penicillium odoratum TaxID=1167516 RepID=UPI00254820F7|nr:uncharacterized protein N7520_002831 [Penicillium odoratum]KAJ5772302.1 hypothetical protein N7520_002831 [Penicillium odoratum]
MNTPDGLPLEIADFVFCGNRFPGFAKGTESQRTLRQRFGGKIIHSSRWDYEYTGGSQENPDMTKLKEKRMGVVGTGATAVQVIPELAKWAKKVVVFQRTPVSVWPRDNDVIPPESEFEKLGWQRKRMENFNALITNERPLPKENLVYDAWTKMQSHSVLKGGPSNLEEGYLEKMIEFDLLQQDAIRKRGLEVVHDKTTAESLTPWYYGWCKRPCFSNVFLQTFNEPHVTLVDTQGQGISDITEKGVMANDCEYEVDVIVFCTGYTLGTAIDQKKIRVKGLMDETLQE